MNRRQARKVIDRNARWSDCDTSEWTWRDHYRQTTLQRALRRLRWLPIESLIEPPF